jgi:prophage antirepressor-like protein
MAKMEGKRANEHANANADIKRAKTDFPLEIVLDGIVYINLSCLLKTAPFAAYFAKHYKKSEKQLIEDDKLELETFNVTMTNVANGVFDPRWPYRPGSDLRLVVKDGKINEFIERVKGDSDPLVPAVIADIGFFEDALGEKHEVEMRGERTVKGIFFKVKDVGRVFGTNALTEDIQHKTAKAKAGEDYVWFSMPTDDKKSGSREVFFTFLGLLRAIMRSNMPGAERLCVWVCEIVLVHGFGTQEQKQKLAKSLLDKKTVDEVTKRCATDIACVYLLETANPSRQENGITKRVYKFGRSKNVKDRMDKHVVTYGHGSVIDTLIFIPVNHLSEAETKLKHTLGKKYAYEDGTQTELLLLSADERNTVRNAMRVVGETFYGETLVHTHQLEMLQQSRDHAIEMLKKDHEVTVEVAKNNAELAKKDGEVAKRDIVILEMKNEIQARRIKELEDKLWLYKTNIANAA